MNIMDFISEAEHGAVRERGGVAHQRRLSRRMYSYEITIRSSVGVAREPVEGELVPDLRRRPAGRDGRGRATQGREPARSATSRTSGERRFSPTERRASSSRA